MSIIRPFCALRPAHHVQAVAAVPYDVVNTEEARQLVQGHPFSFLNVSRPEIHAPDVLLKGAFPSSSEIYQFGLSHFNRLIEECPLIRDRTPSLYIYRLRMKFPDTGMHEQTGIAGCFSINEYDGEYDREHSGEHQSRSPHQIKKHERTRPDKEDDRTQHIMTLSAQTGPVFLTYPNVAAIQEALIQVQKRAPLYDFIASDGVEHTVWLAPQPEVFVHLFAQQVRTLYIADGHHRAAAASRARALHRDKNPMHRGDEEYNFMLGVAFSDQVVKILPYHRVIKTWSALNGRAFLQRLHEIYEVNPTTEPIPPRNQFGMFMKMPESAEPKWFRLKPKTDFMPRELDASFLQRTLLEPLLDIQDPRTDKRIDFVGGIRGTGEHEKMILKQKAVLAFTLAATRITDLIETADRNEIMPPKSTWFEPKLRDGILCHCIG